MTNLCGFYLKIQPYFFNFMRTLYLPGLCENSEFGYLRIGTFLQSKNKNLTAKKEIKNGL